MSSCRKNNRKLVAEGLQKRFGDLPVIDGISFHLRENEFVALLGPSGCGKSTLLNIIAGLLPPDAGRIVIDKEDYTGKTGRVSYMYQKDLLLPWRKVIDNVALPLLIKGYTKKAAREMVKDYLPLFGLTGFEQKYPAQLSGGMRQRAALLRTYMFSRDIILLDEPFGGLDAITKSKMQHWLLDVLSQLKASVLFVTHDIEEAIYLSDRIYILSDRPATVKAEIEVDLDRPRPRDIITSAGFNQIKKRILQIL